MNGIILARQKVNPRLDSEFLTYPLKCLVRPVLWPLVEDEPVVQGFGLEELVPAHQMGEVTLDLFPANKIMKILNQQDYFSGKSRFVQTLLGASTEEKIKRGQFPAGQLHCTVFDLKTPLLQDITGFGIFWNRQSKKKA